MSKDEEAALIAKTEADLKTARRAIVRASVALTRARRRERGLCIDCGDNPVSGRFSRCLPCRKMIADRKHTDTEKRENLHD